MSDNTTTAPRPLLDVRNVTVQFPTHTGVFRAVDDVSMQVCPGETLGLVGESGCGKTTLGRAILRLVRADSGTVEFEGENWTALKRRELRKARHKMQMVFQNPYASLNPRMTVYDALSEPLRFCRGVRGRAALEQAASMMERVGLDPSFMRKFPHEFSGGQRQRIAIARALVVQPRLLIADEPVSSLDVSVQAQIINLLVNLRGTMNLSMIFVSHDLSVVKYLSHRVAVMYRGRIVETGLRDQVFGRPAHPYTRQLLQAVPVADPDAPRAVAPERQDDADTTGTGGCAFRGRCAEAGERCGKRAPCLRDVAGDPGHLVACA